jgi:hypothetical protein
MSCRPRVSGAATLCVLAAAASVWLLAVPPAVAATFRPTSAQAASRPWPITVTIRTVPQLAHVRFFFDGTMLLTGSRGRASITEQHNFSRHTLKVIDRTISRLDRRYRFVRWAGQRDPNQAFRPAVSGLPMRADYTITAGFAVQCQVTPRFINQHGTSIDARLISRVTIRSDAGQELSLAPDRASWLGCLQPSYRDSAIVGRPLAYSVQSIVFAGTNIVYGGIQRFQPGRTPQPILVGYFHDLTITAHDALFGGPVGTEAAVTTPSGVVRQISLGPAHSATMTDLPLGDYQVNIRARHAIISSDRFRLSRDKRVDLAAVTLLDIAAVGGTVVIVALGLPLLSRTRRRRLRGLFRRRSKGVTSV